MIPNFIYLQSTFKLGMKQGSQCQTEAQRHGDIENNLIDLNKTLIVFFKKDPKIQNSPHN